MIEGATTIMKFEICKETGEVITRLTSSGTPLMCGDHALVELKAGVEDAAVEKHVPVVTVEGQTVRVNVGEVTHPMTEAHLILWIALETEQGAQFRWLSAADAPEATFVVPEGQRAKAVYAYCNLHGLWMKEI